MRGLNAHTYKKYHRTCPSTRTKSTEFFLFTVVFLQPFCSLSLFSFLRFFLPPPLPFFLSSYYILWFLHHFLHPRMGQVLGVLFPCSPLLLLEPSTLSCKAACSLFRHHLHINAARELVGQHLMWGQQYFQIFVFSHSYPLSDIFSSSLLQGLSETLP